MIRVEPKGLVFDTLTEVAVLHALLLWRMGPACDLADRVQNVVVAAYAGGSVDAGPFEVTVTQLERRQVEVAIERACGDLAALATELGRSWFGTPA